jgi:hypothetical protein
MGTGMGGGVIRSAANTAGVAITTQPQAASAILLILNILVLSQNAARWLRGTVAVSQGNVVKKIA